MGGGRAGTTVTVLLPMAPPLYPRNPWRRIGENGDANMRTLETWVRGGSFHPYGETAVDRYGVENLFDHPGILELKAGLATVTGLTWTLYAVRAGDGSDYVHCGGHSHPGDAAYMALSLIEEDDREAWEAGLVVGIA